ncbi:globin family protein [Sphingomonas sp.]|uniref:globin family protein n=1 Tax=Sphingomonas sp. TaxID=28214 RepID=UPI003CC68CDB
MPDAPMPPAGQQRIARSLDSADAGDRLKTMPNRQIAIVQASFAQLRPIPDRVGARFYHRLFQLAPETRAMFPDDMAVQGRKLVDTLAAVVDALDHLDTILPAVRALGLRHHAYGVRDEQYGLVGLALIETLREMLGAQFDDELERAWRDAYGLVATAMIEAANAHAAR